MQAKRLRWIMLCVAILLAPIAWYLISPLFITRTVDEAFPETVAAAPAQEMPSAMPSATMQVLASPTSVPTIQPEPTATATPPLSTPTETIKQTARPSLTSTPEPTATHEPTVVPTLIPEPTTLPTQIPEPTIAPTPEPKVVLAGDFHSVTHDGTGNATIYRLGDGRLILRFEQFEVLNGPDLYVWLSKAPDANSAQEIIDAGYFEVGQLKGNQGNQNYELPADLDISQYHTVTVWCRRFSVNFATAPLR